MMKVDDEKLLLIAAHLLNEKYNPPVHSVAAALRTKNGKVFTAVNIDHFSGFVCAETAALSAAINHNEYSFDMIVAVRKNEHGEVVIANMCGKCRQIVYDYAHDASVIVSDGKMTSVKTITELLPYAFTRQYEKIESVIVGEK